METTIFNNLPKTTPKESGVQAPHELQILDSYVDVDFVELFKSSISLSESNTEQGKTWYEGFREDVRFMMTEPDIGGVRLDTITTTVPAIESNIEVKPLIKLRNASLLTPEPSRSASRSNSLSQEPKQGPKAESRTALKSRSIHCDTPDSNNRVNVDQVRPKLAIRIPEHAEYEEYPEISPTTKLSQEQIAFEQTSLRYFGTTLSDSGKLDPARLNAHRRSIEPHTSRRYENPDSHRLADSFARRTPRPAQPDINTRTVMRKLQHWVKGRPDYIHACRAKELRNPYNHLQMNGGCTRERCQGEMYFDETLGRFTNETDVRLAERIQVKETLARFTFWGQLEPMLVDRGISKGVFGKVFEGVDMRGGEGNLWVRTPGSWWARRKNLFDVNRGTCFWDVVWKQSWEIKDAVTVWAENDKGRGDSRFKRKFDTVKSTFSRAGDTETQNYPRKKIRIGTRSEKAISDKWRARRREQEKKAGRWTDGTLRMNQMWSEFHWVLDSRDHRDLRFFSSRNWQKMFEETGYYGISMLQLWAEFVQGWGPMQSWLYQLQLADHRYGENYQIYRRKLEFVNGLLGTC